MRMLIILAAAVLPLVAGCATITRGTTEMIVVDSQPVGADVALSNGMVGVTPASFEVSRKESLSVDVSKDGYRPETLLLTPKTQSGGTTAFLANILLGGLIGMVVDISTGAIKDLVPNPATVQLVALGDAPTANQPPQIQPPLAPPAAPPVSDSVPAPSPAVSKPAGQHSQPIRPAKNVEAELEALKQRRLMGEITGDEYLAERNRIINRQ